MPAPTVSTPLIEFTQAAPSPQTAAPEPQQPIAARVNGQPIWLDDFNRELAAFSAGGQRDDINPPADLAAAILNRMIDQQLIEQNARLLGLDVTEAELAAAIDTLTGGNHASLEAWLDANGISAEQFKTALKQDLLAEQLFDYQTKNIAASAEQVRLFFLWVDSETLAANVTQRLQEVGDFSQVSQEEQSRYPANAGGGYLDWFTAGNSDILPAEVETLAFELEPGQISGPVAASGRYYFVKLAEKDNSRLLSEQELQQKKQVFFAQWLADQRINAEIEVYITLQ